MFTHRNKLLAVAAALLCALLAPRPADASVPRAIAHPQLTQAAAAPSYVLLYVAPDGSCRVVFCRNDPVNATDPLGLADVAVVFVSDNTVSGDTLMHWIKGWDAYVISGVNSDEDMVRKAEAFCARTGHRIKDVGLSGHGYGAGVQTKSGSGIYPARFSPAQQQRLKSLLSGSDATYTAWGCRAGVDVAGLQKIADLYVINARGWTGATEAGPTLDDGKDSLLQKVVYWCLEVTPPPVPQPSWTIKNPTANVASWQKIAEVYVAKARAWTGITEAGQIMDDGEDSLLQSASGSFGATRSPDSTPACMIK